MNENRRSWILLDVSVDKTTGTRAVHVKCAQTGVASVMWQVLNKDGEWVDSLLPRIPVTRLHHGAKHAKRVIDRVALEWGAPVWKEPRTDIDPVTGSNIAAFLMGATMALLAVGMWPYIRV